MYVFVHRSPFSTLSTQSTKQQMDSIQTLANENYMSMLAQLHIDSLRQILPEIQRRLMPLTPTKQKHLRTASKERIGNNYFSTYATSLTDGEIAFRQHKRRTSYRTELTSIFKYADKYIR